MFDDNGFEPAQRWQLTRTALATKNSAEAALWVQAYPNPVAQGQSLSLRVEAQRPGPAEVEVFDALGRPVYGQSAELRTGGNSLVLSNATLAAGLYLIQIRQAGFIQQTRVVQH